MKVSAIVPTYNGASKIHRCLDGLLNQDWRADVEIIVVDDGSVDSTPEIVRQYVNVKLLHQANAGPAAARNAGARVASGDILLFTDDDCEPLPDFMRRLIEPLRLDSSLVATRGAYLTRQKQLVARFRQLEYEEKYEVLARHSNIAFVDTYAAAFRREAFLAIGGYDESLIAAEDIDLSFRLAAKGARMIFVPEARVYHLHTTTLMDFARKKAKFGYWRPIALRKSPSRILSDTHTPLMQKLQLFAPPAMLLALVTDIFSWPRLPAVPVTIVTSIAFILSIFPFLRFAFPRDPQVALMSPLYLFVRASAQFVGIVGAATRIAVLELHRAWSRIA